MKKFQRVAESKQTQLKVKYSKGPLHALRVIFRRILKKKYKETDEKRNGCQLLK